MSNRTVTAVSYAYLTDAQYISAVSIGYISCLLSLFGSCSIIYLVSKRPNVWKDKEQLYDRLVLSLSVTDMITTLTFTIAPIMNRRDTEVLFAKGNTRTCEASAFLFQFFAGTVFFNAMLSIYFVRTVRYGHTTIFKREYLVYLFGFLFPLAVGVHGLLSQALNPSLPLGICTFTKYPFNCTLGKGDCTRGPEQEFRYWLHNIISIILAVTGIVCTWLVYLTIRKQRLTSRRYNNHGSSTLMNDDERKKIRAVAVQAICYTLAFLPALIPLLLNFVIFTVYVTPELEQASDLQDGFVVAFFFITYIVSPLQGFLNWFVYVRPRLVRWKAANMERSWMYAYRGVLSGKQPSAVSSRTITKLQGSGQ